MLSGYVASFSLTHNTLPHFLLRSYMIFQIFPAYSIFIIFHHFSEVLVFEKVSFLAVLHITSFSLCVSISFTRSKSFHRRSKFPCVSRYCPCKTNRLSRTEQHHRSFKFQHQCQPTSDSRPSWHHCRISRTEKGYRKRRERPHPKEAQEVVEETG